MDRYMFRAWDKISDEMIDHDNLMTQRYGDPEKYNIFNDSTHVIMQSTGLKDKNGKLIYEGDVIDQLFEYEIEHGGDEIGRTVVRWNQEMSCFDCDDKPTGFGGLMEEWDECEVIGNIYEHDLLPNKDTK